MVDHGQTWRPVCSSLFPEDPSPVAPFPGVLAIEPARGVAPRSFVPLFGLPLLTVAYPSELSVDRARAGGDAVTVTTAIETTADLSIFSGSSFSVHPDHFGAGATEKREPRKATIAVALAGEIPSAFPGGGEGISVPAHAPGCAATDAKCTSARLFVLATSDLLGSPFPMPRSKPAAGKPAATPPDPAATYRAIHHTCARGGSLLLLLHTLDWILDSTW